MSVADLTFPDPIVLLRERLGEVTDVTTLVPAARILARTGETLPSFPFVRLDLVGGAPIEDRFLDSARVQIHVFGAHEDDVTALTAARTIRAALTATRSWAGTTGVIVGVDIESGPALLYDTTHIPPLVDVTFSVAVLLRP